MTENQNKIVKALKLKLSDVIFEGSNNVGDVYKLRNDYFYTWIIFNGEYTKHKIFERLVERLEEQIGGIK